MAYPNTVAFRLTPALDALLAQRAEQEGRTKSATARELLGLALATPVILDPVTERLARQRAALLAMDLGAYLRLIVGAEARING